MGQGFSRPSPWSAVVGLALAYLVLRRSHKRITRHRSHVAAGSVGALDIRRKAQIAWGKATDHGEDVVRGELPGFDLNKTIFGNYQGKISRMMLTDKLAVELFWCDQAVQRIEQDYSALPPAPRHDQGLVEFMEQDCNFAMEHADGSFMDHLRFCYEYSYQHYRQYSPRVLLLHSIMGVATNFFPMDASKIPKLKGLLTEFEYQHIEAFPSFVRLIATKKLLTELSGKDLSKLLGITFYRVIDNAEISLDAESMWIQLNYHLIHLLDFVPANDWQSHMDDNFLVFFTQIHDLLRTAGKIMAKVDFDLSQASSVPDERPLTLATVVKQLTPSRVLRRMVAGQQLKLSAKIGHDTSYRLQWQS
jgi:hypothetical protein